MEAQIMMQRSRIDVGIDATGCKERRQRGCKPQAVARFGKVERLDAESVARQHDAATVAFPDREREHTEKAFDAARAPRVIRLQDDFRVAIGEEAVAFPLQFGPQVTKIIDATV